MCEENMSGEPMSFMYLDMLANVLYRDMEEMALDFETKSQFCKEQEQKCMDNAINVLSVHQFVNSLNCSMLRLEMDLNENETDLLEAEKTVARLERNCQRDPENPSSRVFPLARATYEDLLVQLLATEKTAAQCNNIRTEIEALHQEAVEKLAPRSLITQIINYHTFTLESMEKQVNQFESRINQMQGEFKRLMEDQKAKKSLSKCPCQPTPGNDPMD
ncbi:hypothetical protein KR038_006353, partial [Drosophila bunnanda]